MFYPQSIRLSYVNAPFWVYRDMGITRRGVILGQIQAVPFEPVVKIDLGRVGSDGQSADAAAAASNSPLSMTKTRGTG